MNTVDLHLHSFYSDGVSSPEVMIGRAKEFGYAACALTDHDGIDGVDRALAEGKRLGIRVIPGIELSSEFEAQLGSFETNRYFMHILGYGIDIHNKELNEALEDLMHRRFLRNEKVRKALKELGVEISLEELQSQTPQGFVGKPSFARVMIARGQYRDVAEAFRDPEFLAHPSIRAIRKEKISAELAIKLIKGAGGMAFFAHPYQLSYIVNGEYDSDEIYEKKLELVVGELAKKGMKGIEAGYPTHNKHEAEFALKLAEENGLLVSRGSDDHGKGARKIKEMGPFSYEIDPENYAWAVK